jgi:hypothetical protein
MEIDDSLLDYDDEEIDEQGGKVDKKDSGPSNKTDEVFLTKEEQETLSAAKAARREELRKVKKAEKVRMEKEKADRAMEEGRKAASVKVGKGLDSRYNAVRTVRSRWFGGKELNRKSTVDHCEEDSLPGFADGEDERWTRNFNIYNVDRGVNVSCSFNPRTGLCYTCIGEPHNAYQGRNGETIVMVLSDQCFPANVPAVDGGECFRVVRVEDGTCQELVNEFLSLIKKWLVVPGMVVMLGSLAHLAKAGPAWYAAEWKSCRSLLKKELGG